MTFSKQDSWRRLWISSSSTFHVSLINLQRLLLPIMPLKVFAFQPFLLQPHPACFSSVISSSAQNVHALPPTARRFPTPEFLLTLVLWPEGPTPHPHPTGADPKTQVTLPPARSPLWLQQQQGFPESRCSELLAKLPVDTSDLTKFSVSCWLLFFSQLDKKRCWGKRASPWLTSPSPLPSEVVLNHGGEHRHEACKLLRRPKLWGFNSPPHL